MGIKLSDEQIEQAEATGFRAWEKAGESGESYLWERRYVSDAATAKAVQEILRNCDVTAKTPKGMTVIRECTALLAEAGL